MSIDDRVTATSTQLLSSLAVALRHSRSLFARPTMVFPRWCPTTPLPRHPLAAMSYCSGGTVGPYAGFRYGPHRTITRNITLPRLKAEPFLGCSDSDGQLLSTALERS